jgi:hypothetical protein
VPVAPLLDLLLPIHEPLAKRSRDGIAPIHADQDRMQLRVWAPRSA